MSEDDPLDFSPISFESTLVAEMPAKVISLETIGEEVFAVLEGGATIPLSSLIDADKRGTVQ